MASKSSSFSFFSSLPTPSSPALLCGPLLQPLAFGISSTVTWPALVDLAAIYAVSEASISHLATFSSLGYLLGSFSGPLFYSRYCNRQLVISLLVVLIALTLVCCPTTAAICGSSSSPSR
ncbi:hypothetical protein TYRP_019456 [Tyrophagus putrescentiae]|nr:hypothetical protein TYRP_019456 [Tyrophagus putrescentiae]